MPRLTGATLEIILNLGKKCGDALKAGFRDPIATQQMGPFCRRRPIVMGFNQFKWADGGQTASMKSLFHYNVPT